MSSGAIICCVPKYRPFSEIISDEPKGGMFSSIYTNGRDKRIIWVYNFDVFITTYLAIGIRKGSELKVILDYQVLWLLQSGEGPGSQTQMLQGS